MKKTTISILVMLTVMFSLDLSAQGDYRNNLYNYTMSSSSTIKPADFVTFNNNIVITGKFPPLSNSIPNITNQFNVDRIFLTDYITAGINFNKSYLIVGNDNINISSDFRYEVKEVKKDNTGFTVCGQIKCNSTSSGVYSEAFILKTDNNGDYQWFYRYKVTMANSTFFNSVEPIGNGGQTVGYVACGYILDSINIKRAIVFQVDTLGKVNGNVNILWEPQVSGLDQESEYKKVILYDNDTYSLVGYCGQVADGCGKHYQSNILYAMYNVSSSTIVGNAYRSYGMSALDNFVDEGVSLAKLDSGIVILSQYYDNNGLSCNDMPDYIGHVLWLNPVNPSNNLSWLQIKDIKYNSDPNFPSIDFPKDIIYDANSGTNRHIWLYNNHTLNTGSLMKINMNTNAHILPPKGMNNNSGLSQINGKTIAFNSFGNTVGLTELYTTRYSIFEIAPSTGNDCQSDSLQIGLYLDSLYQDVVIHDSVVGSEKIVPHKAYTVPLSIYYECDTVYARPSNDEGFEKTPQMLIYPNPITDKAYVAINCLNDLEIVHINIVDVAGRIIRYHEFSNLSKGKNVLQLDMKNLQRGLYFIELIQQDYHLIQKVYIE